MTKQDLINRLARENGLSKTEGKTIIDLTFEKMAATLAQGDRVEIRGLGVFEVRKYKSYKV